MISGCKPSGRKIVKTRWVFENLPFATALGAAEADGRTEAREGKARGSQEEGQTWS